MAVDNTAKPYSGPMLMPAGQYAGRPGVELRRPVYLIGSRTDARIHLQSSTVSRAHALLVQTRHETYIRDLASRTHVFVNGKRVREAVLRHGDLIAIGKFTFQYEGDRKDRGEESGVPPAALQIAGNELPVPIDERVILIGRRPGSDITLTEESASSTHAVIFQWEGLRFIRDLHSRTGTFVNGEQIHETQLNPNDTIRIGETDITYAPSLEEAAFDLISDASDSLIERTPVAEEVSFAPVAPQEEVTSVEPVASAAKAQAAVERVAERVGEPVETIEPIEEFAPLPLADEGIEEPVLPRVAATSVAPEPAAPAPAELPIEQIEPESIPLEPTDPVESATRDVADLVDLATEEAEHAPAVPLAPHDTAHIPLAVAGAENADDKFAEDAANNAVADEALQTPPATADIAAAPAETIEPDEHALPIDTAVTDASVSPDVQGLELLDNTEPHHADLIDSDPPTRREIADTDLPRRGWRSTVTESTIAELIVDHEPNAPATTPTIPETESVAPIEIASAPIETAPAPVEIAAAPEEFAPAPDEVAASPDEIAPAPDEVAVAPVEIKAPPVEIDSASLETALQTADVPLEVEPETNQPQAAEQADQDLFQFAGEQTSTIEPDAEDDATIDLSALLPQDDLAEPIDLAADEAPIDEAPTDDTPTDAPDERGATIDLSAFSSQDQVAEPIDLATDETPADEAALAASLNLGDNDLGVNDLGIDAGSFTAESGTPPVDEMPADEPAVESVDLSTIDFSEPAKTIADLATPTSAAPEELPASELPADAPPADIIPDEFIPTGDVIDEDIPTNASESLSSFAKRRSQSRTRAALERRRKPMPSANETIERTEPTPQSALNLPLPEMPADLPPPPMPLIDTAALSDTTFGRAVAEFEGDGAGPLVEDHAADHADHSADHAEPFALDDDDSHPAEAPLIEAAIPADAHEHESAASPGERTAELNTSDLANDLANLEIESSATDESAPSPADLDLSKLATTDQSATPVDESAAMDFLSEEPPTDIAPTDIAETDIASDHIPAAEIAAAEVPTHAGQATTDTSSEVHRTDIESPAALPVDHPAEPQPAEVEIEGADIEGFGANEEHFLGGEPLSLREGVHPPAGFGVVAVDFTQPPPVLDEAVHDEAVQDEFVHEADHAEPVRVEPNHVGHDYAEAPVIDESHASVFESPVLESPLPESHDILPPEFGDAIVPPQPPTLTSLSAPPTDEPLQSSIESSIELSGAFADPFLAQPMATPVDIPQIEIPPFDAGAPTKELRVESDSSLRGNGKGRKSRVIRNGFGQNPDLPKAGKTEIPPFADSAPGLSGMAMDGLAAPPVRNADVFSEMPSRSEAAANAPSDALSDVPPNASADAPEMPRTSMRDANMRDVGRAMTNDEWMKTTPLPGRSRRRARVTAITPSLTQPIDSPDDAQDSEDSSQATGAIGLTGMGREYIAPRPAILLDDENIANAAAERHRRLVRRVPILCATMIALVGVAITACVIFAPVTQQIQATMSYRNFDSLTHEEQLKFEDAQNQKLRDGDLRHQAIAKLQNRHPNMTPGFLNDPLRFANLKLEWPETRAGEPGIAWINYFDSTDKANDPARVQAVAQAMFDSNSDLSVAAQKIKQTMDQLAGDVKDETRQLEEQKHKIEQERAFLDGRPTLAELNKLKSDDATLEAAYNDAMAKAKGAQADVDQLKKQYATDNAPAAPGTDPVASDAQIKQMSKDADAINAKIAAARKERADLASKARATLDSAYDEFKKQVEGSQTITKDNPQLAAYVTAAQNLQQAIHQLTDDYIQKQQDEYKQLNDLKSSIVTKIQQRQADLFVNDPQLKDLNDKKEILTRQYNEAINSGLDKDAGDKKAALGLVDSSLSARKEIISNDPVYNDLLTGLQQVIDQKQHSIDDQRKKTDEQLASMKNDFDKSTPSVDKLPAEQKQLASGMQEKLANIDAARKQYAEAADVSAGDADASVQAMVNDLQALQTNIETRKRQVAAANSVAAKKDREDQFNAALAQKNTLLDQLNKQLATAQTAYQTNHANWLNRQSVADQSAAAAQHLEEDINNQQQIQANHDQHQAAWEQKSQEYDRAIEPLEPEAQAHLVGAQTDNRVLYAGVSSGVIVVAFLIAICWTVIGAARESHHAYTPSFESLDTPASPKRDRNSPMNGAEPEENQAAVA